MTKYETIKALEKRYHCHINRDTFFDPLYRKEFESFSIYSSDGWCWGKVIGYRALIRTLVKDKLELMRLANLDELIAKGY